MIYQRSVTVAVALAAIVGAAHASPLTPADTSKAYAACMDQSGGVTSAMEDCISEEFELQDRRLNRSYKALMASIPERRPELRDAQLDRFELAIDQRYSKVARSLRLLIAKPLADARFRARRRRVVRPVFARHLFF